MLGHNYSPNTKVTRVSAAVTAGTTDVVSAGVQLDGAHPEVMFVVNLGTITDGAPTAKLQQATQGNFSDAVDLEGSSLAAADTDDDKLLVLSLNRPLQKLGAHVRLVLARGGSTGCAVDSIVALQWGARTVPVTHDSSTVATSKLVTSPAEGTP